jgi:hypothetical protein
MLGRGPPESAARTTGARLQIPARIGPTSKRWRKIGRQQVAGGAEGRDPACERPAKRFVFHFNAHRPVVADPADLRHEAAAINVAEPGNPGLMPAIWKVESANLRDGRLIELHIFHVQVEEPVAKRRQWGEWVHPQQHEVGGIIVQAEGR